MSKRLDRQVRHDVARWRAAPAPAPSAKPATGPPSEPAPAPRTPRAVEPVAGVRVGESPGKGRGVFATRAFLRGEVVEVAPVVVVPADEQARIDGTLLESYLFLWGDTVAFALGFGALYNHAWEPNLEYRKRLDEHVIEFVAVRDIEAGVEVVRNYTLSAPERTGLWSYLR